MINPVKAKSPKSAKIKLILMAAALIAVYLIKLLLAKIGSTA